MQLTSATVVIVILCGGLVNGSSTPRWSTKTGYEASFEPATDEKAQRERSWQAIASDVGETSAVEGCRAVGVYVVHRHGLRYASDGDIEDYNAILARMKFTGVNAQFASLLNITDELYPIALEGELHPAGYAEMEELGARIKARLPELFEDGIEEGFSFQSTYRQRTIDSALGFIEGLLSPNTECSVSTKTSTQDVLTCITNTTTSKTEIDVPVDHALEGDDVLLKFYESCTNYITAVDDNDTAVIEVTKFGDGPEVTAVYEAVANKLAPTGWSGLWNMTKDEMEVMHHMCGYETGYYGSSPWCDIFTDIESLVVEYWLDLKQYWKEGYGQPINYEMACPLVDDVMTYMKSVRSSEGHKGSFKFGHSSTLQPLLTLLGLALDTQKLYANNYDVNVDRAWRSGRISPMSGHIAFNVFQCPSSVHRVLVLHNELPIKVGACQEFFCDFDNVLAHLESASDGCRWDALCGTNGVYPGIDNGASSVAISGLTTLLSTLLMTRFLTS